MSSVCIEGSEDGGGVVCGGSVHVQCVYRGVRGWGRGSVHVQCVFCKLADIQWIFRASVQSIRALEKLYSLVW